MSKIFLNTIAKLQEENAALKKDNLELRQIKSKARHLCRWQFDGVPDDYIVNLANELREVTKIDFAKYNLQN